MSGNPGRVNPTRYWLTEAEFAARQAANSALNGIGLPLLEGWPFKKPIVRVKAKSERA